MRNLLLTAAIPLAAFASLALPASADTVVQRETIITREVSPPAVEYRAYRAPDVHYYTTSRRYHYAPRSGAYVSGYYYGAPAYGYDAPGYTNAANAGCSWLYRRAVDTGSPYWWGRYNDCVD